MASDEPSLPPLRPVGRDQQTRSLTHNRKRLRMQSHLDSYNPAGSSDPAVFSSDDDPSAENYLAARRKRKYVGSWFSRPTEAMGSAPAANDALADAPGDPADSPWPVSAQGKRPFQPVDSGVWLPSDTGSEATDYLPDHVLPLPPESTFSAAPAPTRRVTAAPLTPAEREAKTIVDRAVDEGTERVDLMGLGLTKLSDEVVEPLALITPIPNVQPDVPFEAGRQAEIRLYLSRNSISRLPPALFSLPVAECLTELSLRNNSLTSIPGSIARLKNLASLNLAGNQLRWLPHEFLELISPPSRLLDLVLEPNPWVRREPLKLWPPRRDHHQRYRHGPDAVYFDGEAISDPLTGATGRPRNHLSYRHLWQQVIESATPQPTAWLAGRSEIQFSTAGGKVLPGPRLPADAVRDADEDDDDGKPKNTATTLTSVTLPVIDDFLDPDPSQKMPEPQTAPAPTAPSLMRLVLQTCAAHPEAARQHLPLLKETNDVLYSAVADAVAAHDAGFTCCPWLCARPESASGGLRSVARPATEWIEWYDVKVFGPVGWTTSSLRVLCEEGGVRLSAFPVTGHTGATYLPVRFRGCSPRCLPRYANWIKRGIPVKEEWVAAAREAPPDGDGGGGGVEAATADS